MWSGSSRREDSLRHPGTRQDDMPLARNVRAAEGWSAHERPQHRFLGRGVDDAYDPSLHHRTGQRLDSHPVPPGRDLGALGRERAGMALHRPQVPRAAGGRRSGGGTGHGGDRAGVRHDPPAPTTTTAGGPERTAPPTSSTIVPASSPPSCSPRSGTRAPQSSSSAVRSSRRCRTSCSPPAPSGSAPV